MAEIDDKISNLSLEESEKLSFYVGSRVRCRSWCFSHSIDYANQNLVDVMREAYKELYGNRTNV